MAITLNTSGPYVFDSTGGIHTYTSYGTYSFCSGIITTTASYDNNVLDFGVGLAELWIVNAGANPLCFQFPEYYGLTKDSGIVLASDKIFFRRLNKRGVKIRSADTSLHTTAYVFGV